MASAAVQGLAEHFHLPLTAAPAIVTLAALLFLLVPLLFRRLRVPPVIGLILAGIVIGPHGLGWLERSDTIRLLGTLGLLYLMFHAALEIDLHGFHRYRSQSVVLGVVTFVLPLAFGVTTARFFDYDWPAAILLGSMLASHTLLAYPIASRLGIGKNIAVTAAVGGTIVTDLIALLALAIIAAAGEGKMNGAFWVRLILSLAIFSAITLVVLPRVANWFFRRRHANEESEFLFVGVALFGSAFLAEVAGFEAIIGAFFAGLALNALVAEGTPLQSRVQFFGDTVLVPFFLLSVGMLVDFRVFIAGPRTWAVMAAMIVSAVTGKWLAARIMGWRYGYSRDEWWTVFGLSIPQAAATLALVLVGYRLKLFDATVLNGAVVLILFTCTLGPAIVEHFGRRVAHASERPRPGQGTRAERVLIPVADAESGERLIDLALLMRAAGSKEPLLPLTVVEDSGRDASSRVEVAEKLLAGVVSRGAAAAVPVQPLRHVAPTLVAGIARAAIEWRSTALLVSWLGRRSRRTGILTDALDELLARTPQLVMVAKVERPLNTVTRVLLVIPRYVDRSPGFNQAVEMVKQLTNHLKAELVLIPDAAEADEIAECIRMLRPTVPTAVEPLAPNDRIEDAVRVRAGETELVAVISERRGMAAWSRALDRLPRALADLTPGGLLLLYPCPTSGRERHGVSLLTDAVDDGRMLVQPEETTLHRVVEQLLRTEVQDEVRLASATAAVVRAAESAPVELAPGVVFLCTKVESIAVPRLFLCVSRDGLSLPSLARPARVIVIVTSPGGGESPEARYLADLAPILTNAERIERLVECDSAECVATAFRRGRAEAAA